MTKIDMPTRVYACAVCGHVQSEDLADVQKFYDTDYRISLESSEHDQLYAVVKGKPIFRTDRQAELVLETVKLPQGALVLDYGAAKAATLKDCGSSSGFEAARFDVSNDYISHWRSWVPEGQYATYVLPKAWQLTFDLVTAHFVLEHVSKPHEMLRAIRQMLKPNGVLFLSVPDFVQNPGDLIVVDHLNHFTPASLERALFDAGFSEVEFAHGAFDGALVISAKAERGLRTVSQAVSTGVKSAREVAAFWSKADASLVDIEVPSKKIAIYGAGFYGSFIATRILKRADVICFVDRNPHLVMKPHMGLPVVLPKDLPAEVETIYAGVNPRAARSILQNIPEWAGRSLELRYLDETK